MMTIPVIFLNPIAAILFSCSTLAFYAYVKMSVSETKRRIMLLLRVMTLYLLSPTIVLIFSILFNQRLLVFYWSWFIIIIVGAHDIRSQTKQLETIRSDRTEGMPAMESASTNGDSSAGDARGNLWTGYYVVLFIIVILALAPIWGPFTFILGTYVFPYSLIGWVYVDAHHQFGLMESEVQHAAV